MMDVLPFLAEMEHNGFYVDLDFLKKIEAEEKEKLDRIRNDLTEALTAAGFPSFNLRSSKQKQEFIYSRRLIPEWKKTYTKFVKAFNPFKKEDEEQFFYLVDHAFEKLDYGLHMKPVVESMTASGLGVGYEVLTAVKKVNDPNETLNLFIEIGRQESFHSRYIEGTLKEIKIHNKQAFLHTSFNQSIAKTGRLTSTRPNMQNWPRTGKFKIKEAIRSRFEGGSICKADESQIELRALGWYYGDTQLKEDYENGIDIHGKAAEAGFGKDFSPEQRNIVKTGIVFRSVYWGSAFAISKDITIPLDDPAFIQKIIDGLFSRYHAWASGRARDLSVAKETGYIICPSGMVFDYRPLCGAFNGTGKDHFSLKNKVANWPIQHMAAVILYCAIICAGREFQNLRSLLIGTVHDEIVADVYPGEEEEVRSIMNWALTEGAIEEVENRFGFRWDFPLEASVDIMPSWGG